MQGIYQGFRLDTHDMTWTCLLDLVQQPSGACWAEDAYTLIEQSGHVEVSRW